MNKGHGNKGNKNAQKNDESLDSTLSIRLTSALKSDLSALAEKMNISTNQLINNALTQFVDYHKTG